MNYSINLGQRTYTVTVYNDLEKSREGFIRLRTKSYAEDPVFKKLVEYAKKKNISVYEMALIGSEGGTAVQENKSWDAYFTSESRGIMINHSVPEYAKTETLLCILCVREAFNKYWRLYMDRGIDSKREFDNRVKKTISRVMKIVGWTEGNAA